MFADLPLRSWARSSGFLATASHDYTPKAFEEVTIEPVSDEQPRKLRMDHCFNAMSKYNWAAELVRDITITSPFHSKIIIGQRCSECGTPAPQLAPEIQQHAAGLNRLEEHGRTESDEEVPRAVTTQQPTKPNKMNEGPESSELRAFEQKGSSTGSDECNKSDGGWNLPGECPVIEHNYGMDLESLSSLTNIQTLRWAGLETSKDHLHVLREICKANQGHLTSLDLDLYSWSMVNSSWHRRSEISSGPQSRPQSSNLFVSELLNRTGTLTALESLSIRKASLRDVSIDYAKCLNIGRLRSLHLHRCKQASSFLNGLASAVEKKQIHLSLTDFELMLDEPSPYGTYVGRFLECFTGLWRGIRYKNETLRDLIFHNEDIDCMALSKRKEYPIWEHAAGTLSVLYLHRFAYYGHLAENDSCRKALTAMESLCIIHERTKGDDDDTLEHYYLDGWTSEEDLSDDVDAGMHEALS